MDGNSDGLAAAPQGRALAEVADAARQHRAEHFARLVSSLLATITRGLAGWPVRASGRRLAARR